MIRPFKILIVDDHPMVSYGTKMILEQIDNVIIVGIAETGEKCLRYVSEFIPDLVLLDYNLPDQNGSELTKQIKERYEAMHVVIFSGSDLKHMYNRLLSLNISGILAKNANAEQIKNMVRSIMEGQTVISLELFKQLRISEPEASDQLLSEQEVHIMSMVVDGRTAEQIAESIFSSKRSVDNYLKKVYEKLGAKGRIHAIQLFIENKRFGRDSVG
jgi:two-component system competent response regulator ComA